MRFFHDGAAINRDMIPPLPSRSLTAAVNGAHIIVAGANGYVLANLHYSEIQRQDGTAFASASAAKSYLDGVFSAFPGIPEHVHTIGDVTGLQGALDSKQAAGNYASAVHTHVIADVAGLQSALDGKQPVGAYAPAVHTHTIANVTGLQSALDGKQAAGSYALLAHTHAIADVTGLQAALDGKAALSHTHVIANITGLQAALDAKLGTTVTPSTPARAFGTAFQPSATKAVLCLYSVKTQVTNPLLVGTSTATARLLCDVANPPMTERARVEATSGVGITVTIAMTTSNTALLIYLCPPGHYVLLTQSTTGTGAVSLVSQTEIALG